MYTLQVMDGLNAVPTTSKEKADCQKILSPQELYQILVGPPLIDFGPVCLRSISRQEVSIVNNLEQYVHVNVQVSIPFLILYISKALCNQSTGNTKQSTKDTLFYTNEVLVFLNYLITGGL